jgi:hypothetical protein
VATLPGPPTLSTTADVAVVEVFADSDTGNFGTYGFAGTDSSAMSSFVFANNSGVCTTSHAPGSDYAAFTYSGSYQQMEPCVVVTSGGTAGHAIAARATVTLVAPEDRPSAIGELEVGFIQHLSLSQGTASYGTVTSDTSTITLVRTAAAQSSVALD